MYVYNVSVGMHMQRYTCGDQKTTVELILSFCPYVGSMDQIEVPRLVHQVPLPPELSHCPDNTNFISFAYTHTALNEEENSVEKWA